MNITTPAKCTAAALVLALLCGPAAAQTPNAQAPHAMTNIQPASDALSARQQAIPLIASFMAASDMPRLNAALHQGLDVGLTVSEAKEILVQL